MRLADCVRCGAGIGFKNESLCHRCRAADQETRLRAECPSCGEFLRLQSDSGQCVRCSRRCVDCGHVLRFKTSMRCRGCRRRAEALQAKSPCPRCGQAGFLRVETGWCGSCSRRPSPPLPVRPCSMCGELRRKKGEGMCHRCWTRSPTRPTTQAENLSATLEDPPEWLVSFAAFAVERHCVARACVMVTAVGRLLRDGQPSGPQALLERGSASRSLRWCVGTNTRGVLPRRAPRVRARPRGSSGTWPPSAAHQRGARAAPTGRGGLR